MTVCRPVSLAALWVLWAALVGCAAGDPCASGPSPSIELGEGDAAFEELTDPPSMELVFGPQGGVHLEVAVRGRGVPTQEGWAVALEGRLLGEVRASAPLTLVTPACSAEGSEVYGVRLIFDNGVALTELNDPLEISGTVTYVDGVAEDVVSGVMVVVP
ncbi:MAG: hypothetical protein KDA24_02450 [Deltaproteobacteria bacterium]|nr:hypothetical protein [Deltaproteobacteria bacterium]